MGGHRASGAGDDPVDGPVDLAAVRADDALLDAIAGAGPTGVRAGRHGAGYGFSDGGFAGAGVADGHVDDDRIAAVLAAWKADIEADPMPELVSLDEAVEAVTAGHQAHHRVAGRNKRRMPFAVAAAAAIVAVSGLTVAVHGAAPGDTLWGVNKVLFSEHAAQVQKVEDVRTHINDANRAIDQHDYVAARRYLQQADVALPAVPPQEQAPLTAARDKAESSLTPTTPSESVLPGKPGTLPGSTSGSSTARGGPGRPGTPVSPSEPGAAQHPPTSPTQTTAPDSTTGTGAGTPTGPTTGSQDTRGRSGPAPTSTASKPTSGMSSSGTTSGTG